MSRYYELSRFTHVLEDLGQKKCSFSSGTVFLGQKVPYYMVNIAYYTEFNLQICNYAQKRSIFRENRKTAPDEIFVVFLSLPKGCQLLPPRSPCSHCSNFSFCSPYSPCSHFSHCSHCCHCSQCRLNS